MSLELALLGWGLWRSRRLIRRAAPVREPLLLGLFARLAQRLGLHREPGLRLSSEVQTPQALGGLRPQVLLPQRRVSALSPAEIEMTLCHELVHVRRGDLWLAWVPALAQRLFFFFPPAAWAAREYLVAREAACDAEVLRVLGSAPQAYGRLLLRWGVAPRETGLAAAGASPSLVNLKRRLQMLHETSETTRRSRLRWGLAGAAALVALLPFTIVAQQRTPEPPEAAEPAVAAEAAEPAEPALAPEPGEPMPAPEAGEAVEAADPEEAAPAVEPGEPAPASEPEWAEAAEPDDAEAPEPAEMPAPPPGAPMPPPSSRAQRAETPVPVLAPRAVRAPHAVPGPMPVAMAIEAPAPRAPRTPLPPGAAPVAVAPSAARAPRTPLPPDVAPVAIAPRLAGAPRTPPPMGAAPVAIAPPAPRAPRTPLPPGAPVAMARPASPGALWTPRPPGSVPAPPAVAGAAVPAAPATWTPRPGSTPRARIPGRAAMVVAQAPPPVPPAPPAPPRPPKPGKGHSTSWYSHDGDQPWVYLSGNDTSMSGSRSDVEEAKRLRGSSGGHLFWFKRDGKAYVVRDAATLARIEELWKPVGELGAQQGKLGGEQGRLGGQQGMLGAKQGALGARMGALAAQQAGSGERDEARYEKESEELQREMEKLGEQQEELGRQQEVLGRQQEALGKKQEEASRRAESELDKLMDETLRNGLAQPVK